MASCQVADGRRILAIFAAAEMGGGRSTRGHGFRQRHPVSTSVTRRFCPSCAAGRRRSARRRPESRGTAGRFATEAPAASRGCWRRKTPGGVRPAKIRKVRPRFGYGLPRSSTLGPQRSRRRRRQGGEIQNSQQRQQPQGISRWAGKDAVGSPGEGVADGRTVRAPTVRCRGAPTIESRRGHGAGLPRPGRATTPSVRSQASGRNDLTAAVAGAAIARGPAKQAALRQHRRTMGARRPSGRWLMPKIFPPARRKIICFRPSRPNSRSRIRRRP